MSTVWFGIDNGVTGSIGIIADRPHFFETPTRKEQNYTKAKQNITRIDVGQMMVIIDQFSSWDDARMFAVIERPLVNPKMWKATLSAIRALESTITILEAYGMGYTYIDSKKWQKELLPKGTQGTTELKKASRQIGSRLFPEHAKLIDKHGDADGLLIAEFARRNY